MRWCRREQPSAREQLAARAQEAGRIVERMRGVPPQHATAQTVAAYERAAEMVSPETGSRIWFEAMIGLGAHLLESPHGDRRRNVERAVACYRRAMEFASSQDDAAMWTLAASGYANSLAHDPAARPAVLAEALQMLVNLTETYRLAGAVEPLAVTLAQTAAVLAKMPQGDLEANLEAAIRLQEEAVRITADGDPALTAVRGRARHNLGVYVSRRRGGVRSDNGDRAVRSLWAARSYG